ncbi:transposase family protein [Nonomuraea sp. NPDC050153]|uniref:transposase family protein n=1 Tax=Nonomuraea sp. NPDC050153 TaxID=3364359 RepID=UPI0037A585C3
MSPSSLTSPRLIPALDQLADLALWEAELAAGPLIVESALMRRLATVPDRRSACGLRHPLVVILTLTACATLVVGSDGVAAIWQWAARTSQGVLERLGAYRDPFTGLFVVPSEKTFRRVLAGLDADALDTAISGYVAEVVRREAPVPQIPTLPAPWSASSGGRFSGRSPTLILRDCCPAPRSMARSAAALAPSRVDGSSWSARSATSTAWSWASARSRASGARDRPPVPC